jgi:serine protease Do
MRFIASTILMAFLAVNTHLRAEEAKPATYPVSVDVVPRAFDLPAPKSVEDLRAMQEHLTSLIPRLMECTVNIQIGGAQGSGLIVDPDGYILTAAHVSGRPGKEVSITMPDGNRYRGHSLGRNKILDASIVKIKSDRTDWPYCSMAVQNIEDEAVSKPGDWCIVVAHPGGYQKERGLVIRLGRVILSNGWMIQTDCELVGGDSGGPLFGVDGKVIGINTRIGESTDLNFHVPIEAFTRDWDRLVKSEDFRTHSGAYLGVMGVVKPGTVGMKVTKIYAGDPADRAGIKEGDILMTFQSRKVTSMQQLYDLVGEEVPGKSVKIELIRGSETLDIDLRLGMRWD